MNDHTSLIFIAICIPALEQINTTIEIMMMRETSL